jgi:hypothetical protein
MTRRVPSSHAVLHRAESGLAESITVCSNVREGRPHPSDMRCIIVTSALRLQGMLGETLCVGTVFDAMEPVSAAAIKDLPDGEVDRESFALVNMHSAHGKFRRVAKETAAKCSNHASISISLCYANEGIPVSLLGSSCQQLSEGPCRSFRSWAETTASTENQRTFIVGSS